jgi:Outer membrane protein beta-barrel domain
MHSEETLMRIAAVMCVVLAAAAPASADWTAGAFLGASFTRPNSITVRTASIDRTFDDVHYAAESFRSPQYYGVRGGYYFARRPSLGIEGEFIHLKAFATITPELRAAGIERFSISHGLNYVLANVAWRRPLGADADRPRGWITARAGAGLTVPHGESMVGGIVQQQYERGGAGVQLAAGGEVRVASGLTAFGEYKLTHASPTVSVAGGTIEGGFLSHQLAFGLAWHSR